MAYIEVATLRYPISERYIRMKFPQISFPKDFHPPEGYASVQRSPQPVKVEGSRVIEKTPVLLDGQWVQRWEVVEFSDAEKRNLVEGKRRVLEEQVRVGLTKLAQAKGYDTIESACSYALSENADYAAEGLYCVRKRDTAWQTLYQALSEVDAGQRQLPTDVSELGITFDWSE